MQGCAIAHLSCPCGNLFFNLEYTSPTRNRNSECINRIGEKSTNMAGDKKRDSPPGNRLAKGDSNFPFEDRMLLLSAGLGDGQTNVFQTVLGMVQK